ncbi:hypothetical protein BGW38_007617 [Lunasporangiospora selenospora]|uniref:Uncharacterized protein n=1 Tax=Lunasporangiospora selenospora TaxID=979761 RepID=A0A9P6FZ32_9FUNG|nr:hypothetical protein BGW38_007617 [Lunasporangiospora selenospora]
MSSSHVGSAASGLRIMSIAPPAATATAMLVPLPEAAMIIKIEDDGDVRMEAVEEAGDQEASKTPKAESETEIKTYGTESMVGDLFGYRWRTEPMVGYTLVHFGGSDRTRVVPMNPTVSFMNVMFNRQTESVELVVRVLVNELCLLSSGGGPPARHMPEMTDEEEEEPEEEEEKGEMEWMEDEWMGRGWKKMRKKRFFPQASMR